MKEKNNGKFGKLPMNSVRPLPSTLTPYHMLEMAMFKISL